MLIHTNLFTTVENRYYNHYEESAGHVSCRKTKTKTSSFRCERKKERKRIAQQLCKCIDDFPFWHVLFEIKNSKEKSAKYMLVISMRRKVLIWLYVIPISARNITIFCASVHTLLPFLVDICEKNIQCKTPAIFFIS